jgi:hypothetical protein
MAWCLAVRHRRRARAEPPAEQVETFKDEDALLRRVLVGSAVVLTGFVAAVAGRASWFGISSAFGGWHAPAMVDGFVLAVTLLRLGMLTQGWPLPGSVAATVCGLAVTGYFNYVQAVRGHRGGPYEIEAVITPLIYFVLAEYLALLIKHRLRLRVQKALPRISLALLISSPAVSIKALLHMARNGLHDPVAARAAVSRASRARSELKIICPGSLRSGGRARRARRAAEHAIRDGLLSASQIVELLPPGATVMDPIDLLRQVNRAAVGLAVAPSPTPASDTTPPEPPKPAPAPEGGPKPGGVKGRVFELAAKTAGQNPSHPLNSDNPRVRNDAVRALLAQLGANVSEQSVRKYGIEWSRRRTAPPTASP